MSIWHEPGECFVASGTAALIAGLAAAGGGAATTLYGAHKASEANQNALTAQTQANQAAVEEQKRQDAQQKAEFDAQQAALQKQWEAEQAIRAPYRAAGASALSNLGSILGVNFPAPSAASGPAPTSTPSGPLPSIDPSKGDLGSQISAYFKSRGVSDQETPYWVGKWAELTARGKELNDPQYAAKRLAAADVFGGAAGASASPTASALRMPRVLAPQMTPVSGNALAANYNQVIPISQLFGPQQQPLGQWAGDLGTG